MALVWTSRARHDLAEIYIRVHYHDPDGAERLLFRLEERATQLETFSRLGVRRSDVGPHIRTLPHGPYLILYELYPDTEEGPVEIIEIVRVVDGRTDLKRVIL